MPASLLAEPAARGVAVLETAPRPRRVVVLASLARSLIIFRGQLLRAMVEAGHEVLALAPENDPGVAVALARNGVRYRAVPMARVALHPLADLRTVAELVRILRRFRPDVILAYTMKPIIYGGLAAQLAAVPHRYAMITGLGYVYTDSGDQGADRRVLRIVSGILYRWALRGIEAVFVYNPDDERELTGRGMVSPRQRVIRVAGSGIDLTHFAEVALPSGPPVFLLIARLLRDKGLFEYVEAARMLKARHPGVRVQLLGPFDLNPTAIDREQLETWVREGVIEYLGETEDVRPSLAACTVYVLPSYREGVPRTVLEAMATGRAIITTDAPGCRETVVPNENGLVVPVRDPVALALAMERFVSEPGLAARMGRRSREIAAARFEVHKVNRVLLDSMGLL
ncbi:MAG: glycosyltransferase family 4 protein [Gammaproteobacteria bacterium]